MGLSRPLPGEYDERYGHYLASPPEGSVLALLEAQAKDVRALYGSLSEGQGAHRYAPGKWSLKDLLQHLTDCECIFTYRCLRIARGDQTPLPGFDENAYAASAQAESHAISALLGDFQATRNASLALFRSVPEGAWTRQGTSNGRLLSARCLPYFALGHAAHHLAVIRERYLPGLK